MDRVFQSGAVASPPSAPASPSNGYPTAGDPLAAIPATRPGAWWYYMITESLMQVLTDGGITPDHEDFTLLSQAITALAGAPQLVKETTAAQAYAANTQYTFAHSLGVVPGIVQLKARCLTADGGYSVGDVVCLAASNDDDISGGIDLGYATKVTSTHIYLSMDLNHPMHFHKWNDSNRFTMTDGYWEFFYFAMA